MSLSIKLTCIKNKGPLLLAAGVRPEQRSLPPLHRLQVHGGREAAAHVVRLPPHVPGHEREHAGNGGTHRVRAEHLLRRLLGRAGGVGISDVEPRVPPEGLLDAASHAQRDKALSGRAARLV